MSRVVVTLLLCILVFEASASCRRQSVKHKFDVSQGYPKGRPGHIVDHTCALACGGIDSISNMQYQIYEDSRKKDKWETTTAGCLATCTPTNSTPTRQVFNCK